jgi:hypothetical protein
MPIQRRSAPTLEGVNRQIEAFEHQYKIDTDVFLNDCHNVSVNEDDAMEWAYLVEQRSALLDAAIGTLYGSADVEELENSDSSLELLAA